MYVFVFLIFDIETNEIKHECEIEFDVAVIIKWEIFYALK